MEELMKVPYEVIIKQLQEEVKALRKKNHEVCTKAKEREKQWKAYTEELLNTIRVLEEDNDEEKKLRIEVKAMKKMNEDYNQLLTQHNNVVERYKLLKLQVKELKSELECTAGLWGDGWGSHMKDTFEYWRDWEGIEYIRLYLEADCMDRAIKIASERIAQIKANKDMLYAKAFTQVQDPFFTDKKSIPNGLLQDGRDNEKTLRI